MSAPFRSLSLRRMFARPFAWFAAAAALTVLAGALAPWTVSRGALREEVAAQLRSSAGLYVFPRGSASVSLLPRPRIRLDDVAFVDPNGALVIEAAALTGDVRLHALLAGRLEIAEVALLSPRITVDVDRAPLTTAGAAVRASVATPASPDAAKADAARLGVVSVKDGTVILRRNGERFAGADRVDARLDWRTVGSPAAVTAELDWHGRRQQLVAWAAQPAALLRGGDSPVTFEVRSRDASLATAGTVSLAGKASFGGRVRFSTRSTPDVLKSLNIDVPVPAVLDSVTFEGDMAATPTGATLTNLRLATEDESFEGTLALQAMANERPLLSGTLAARSLSLGPYLATTPVLSGADGRLSAEPIDLAGRKGPDVDLRLSVAHLRYGRVQARDAALSVTVKGGRVEVSLADAAFYGGVAKGRAVLEAEEGVSKRSGLRATLLLRGVDWATFDRDLSGRGRLTGTADVSASLQTSGDSFLHMARSLAGHGRIALTRGDLGGLDVPGTLARLDKRPLAAATDLGSGRTPFDRAVLPFEIENGTAKIAGGELASPHFSMTLNGTVQIPDGQAAMTAAVRPTAAPPSAGSESGFSFDVAGSWSQPSFTADIQSLIRRSGAASPLFGVSSPASAAGAGGH